MMSRRPVASAILLLASVVLSGCAADRAKVVPVATEPDLVSTRIAQAAEKAARALDTVSGIEQQRTPYIQAREDYSNAPPVMVQPITIRWTGPIEQIVQTLASRAGLAFSAKGARPPVPLTVTVDVYQQPLIEVMRDVGLQAGQRADLTVDARAGIIEIRYAPVDKL